MRDYGAGKDGLAVIVVGVDGTSCALHAAAWASGLALRERARLVFVYVEPLTSPAYWSPIGMATAAEVHGSPSMTVSLADDPFQVGRAAAGHGQGDHGRNLVRMRS